MGWAEGLANGLASGIQLGNSIQRNQAMQQEQDWKAEDRKREKDERNQLDTLGKVMSKIDQGDLNPAIAQANSSGTFGPDRYASGARIGEDGHVYANVYNNNDPVNSMEEVKLGKLQDIKNQVFMANAPPSVVAKLSVAQAQRSMDPTYQQQAQSGALDIQRKQAELGYLPQKQALDLAQGQAGLAHSAVSTAATQQSMQQQALTSQDQLRKAKADADHAEWVANNPRLNVPAVGSYNREDKDGNVVIEKLFPGDPRLQSSATGLAGPQGAPAQQPIAPTSPAAPAAQPAAPQQQQKKTLNSDTIKQYLLKAGGDTKKARAMAESEGWSF